MIHVLARRLGSKASIVPTVFGLLLLCVFGCTTPPTREISEASLRAQFKNHPVADVFAYLGKPFRDDQDYAGSRTIVYRRAYVSFESGFDPTSDCEARFQVTPGGVINDIQLNGSPYKCDELARGNSLLRPIDMGR